MEEKIVLVTGASSGLGKAIAEYLQGKHYRVYGTSRHPKSPEINGVHFLKLDLTEPESIKSAVDEIVQREGRLDFLINNAGKGITGAVEETPDEEILKAMNVNYFGALRMIKAVVPIMRKQGSGMIINITSIAGYTGLPFRGIYSATKAAMEMTTEALRIELRPFHIKVSNIAPGDFATNIAAGRYHTPLDENSPYYEKYSKSLKGMDKEVKEGMDPVKLAEKVHRIMQEKNPAIHYKIGKYIQRISIRLKQILPDKLYEKLLIKYLNIGD